MNIKDLLENKGILDEKNTEKTKVLEIKSLKSIGDGKIKIKNIDDETFDRIGETSKTDYELNKNALYNAVIEPNLKDKELQEGLGCKTNPIGIVRKLFTRAEIENISEEIGKLSGMYREKGLIKEIKNA
ncbi:phage tail assembly chaperone [Clostridium cagae]|uniref:phage tail assembly chaperone n=1 Tax=Clostridium cagae TaxID=2080751 RepID=UPI003F763A71